MQREKPAGAPAGPSDFSPLSQPAAFMSVSRRKFLTLASAALGLFAGGRAVGAAPAADSPAAVIQEFYDVLLAVMRDAKRLSFDQRYGRLQPIITRTFNLELMTRIAVGPEWARLMPEQQQRLGDAFARYTISTYTSRFDGFSGERFDVDGEPVQNPNGIIVQSRLVKSDGERIGLNYLMRRDSAGRWQIIDVFLSGTVSELATRRSEFVSVLQRDGADGLVRLLEQRVAALRTG